MTPLLVGWDTLCELLDVSGDELQQIVSEHPAFPKPIALTAHCQRWLWDDVQNYVLDLLERPPT